MRGHHSVNALTPRIEQAEIDWTPEGEPVSRRHGDVYFSRDDGLAETDYVFLQGNRLPQRFLQLDDRPGHFVIAETGFGTGLNFLAAARLWLSTCRPGQVLHFISFERYPLSQQDLQRALARWPELEALAAALLDQYPEPVKGTHRLILFAGRIRLTLYWGDALEGMERLAFYADAWFLDGFAPARNPDLWQSRLLDAIAAHTRAGGTLSTFTAVGAVRRHLQDSGFAMKKVKGYGRKREMLCGQWPPGIKGPCNRLSPRPTSAVIIGAGMAGCLTAYALASRGVQVTLLEAGPRPAQGASGNDQGGLYVKLGVDFNAQTRLALSGLLFSQRFYQQMQVLSGEPSFWHPTGLLQLAWSGQEQRRQAKFLKTNCYPDSFLRPVDSHEASDIAGIPIGHPGLWFPKSGWLSPPLLCQQAIQHPDIDAHFNSAVETLSRDNQGGWQLITSNGAQWHTDILVLCTGAAMAPLTDKAGCSLPIKTIRGQITTMAKHRLPQSKAVLCAEGYLNPPSDGKTLIGASFDLRDSDPNVRQDSHRENLERLARWLPDHVPTSLDFDTDCAGRVAFRATLPDYQPLAGELSESSPGLYVLGGLGSKGLSFAPLLAETLADMICQQPYSLETDLIHRLSPGRFKRSKH